MKNIRKIIILSSLILALVICLCACSTSKSFTYKVDTGELVKITLDTSNSKYDIKANGSTFELYNDEQLISQGCFMDFSAFDKYKEAVNLDKNAEIIEETSTKIVYYYEDDETTEYDMILCISDKTGVVVGSELNKNVTKDIAADALSRLSFSIEE